MSMRRNFHVTAVVERVLKRDLRGSDTPRGRDT